MKRLLAYLLIVLGLVLTFSVNGNATTIKFQNCVSGLKDGPFKDFGYWTTYEVDLKKNKVITTNGSLATNLRPASSYKSEYEIELNDSNKLLTKKIETTKYSWTQIEFNKKTNKVRIIYTAYLDGKVKKVNGTWKLTDYRIDERFIYEHCDKVIGSWKNNKTQIAKAEPSQTQKVVSEITYDWVAITKHPKRNKNFIATKLSTKKKAIDLAMMKCYKYVTNSLSKKGYNDCSLVNVYNEKNKDITQLVKNESGQSLDFENYKNFRKWSILHKYDGRYFWNDSVNLNLKEAIAESAVDCVSQIKRYSSNLRVFPKDCKLNTIQIVSINNKKKIFKPSNTKELNKLIAKNLALLDEKTSTKIVKKQKPKQEEFKPEKTNQDNEAPIITIAEAITVNDASYEIEGKVSDSSMNIFITVDGRTIPVKEGKFRIKRFSPVDEQIEIIATDQWGNRSQPKLVNITIDQQETIVADIFETLDPSKIKTRSNKNRVALIIGIEKYDQTPEASYANLDAKYFYEYVRKGFGVSKSNIKLLVDEDANLIKSLGTINKWLPGKIKGGKTELIIFFAGHGLASNDGKELYLLPQDSDPDLLARTALSRTELFNEIIALNPKSVTMFLDTCYSGVSRDERTLLASARPVRIVADEQDTPNNFTIFSASQLDQISSGLKEANHGIFSYYLMKGLEGKADSNQDKKITNGELLAYMDENVSQKASELGRQQNPSLAGDPDKILMSYR